MQGKSTRGVGTNAGAGGSNAARPGQRQDNVQAQNEAQRTNSSGRHIDSAAPVRPAVAAMEQALIAARAQLHQQGRFAGFHDALEKAWPNIQLQPSTSRLSREDVVRMAKFNQSPYAHEFFDRDKRVRFAISAFQAANSGVATLYDLENFILEREQVHTAKEVAATLQCYKDLRMGPLYRHPEIVRVGLAHQGMDDMPTPKVTRVEVLEVLRKVVQKKRTKEHVAPEDVMLALELEFQKPCRDLGVAIGRHLGLMIGDLFAMARITSKEIKDVRERLVMEAGDQAQKLYNEGLKLLRPVMEVTRRRLEVEVAELRNAAKDFASATAARIEISASGAGLPPLEPTAVVEALHGHLCRLLSGSAELQVFVGQGAVEEVDARMARVAALPLLSTDVLETWRRLVDEDHPKAPLLEYLKGTSTVHGSAEPTQGPRRSARLPKKAAEAQAAAQAAVRDVAADLAQHLHRALEGTALLVGQWRRVLAQQPLLGYGGAGGGGGGGGSRPRGPPVSWRRLREAVATYNQGLSFRALAALERDVARALGSGTFADLGRGESLLAVLAENHELASELAGGNGVAKSMVLGCGRAGDGASASLEEILVLVMLVVSARRRHGLVADGGDGRERMGSSGWDEDDATAVEEAIRRQYAVPSAIALGFGPVQRLLSEAMCDATDTSQAVKAAVVPELGLAPLPSQVAANGGNSGEAALLGSLLCGDWDYANPADAAAAVLDAAPVLSDLAAWSSWQDVFAPHLGSLKAYLMGSAACSMQRSWRVVDAPGGQLFKVQAGLGVEGAVQLFAQRLGELDACGMAAALLSVVVEAGGVELAPMRYLESLVEGRWSSAVEASVAPTGGGRRGFRSREAPHLPLLRCCLDCLEAIPLRDLRTAMARRVLLPPLESAHILGRGWQEELLRACTRPEHRTLLHLLGFDLRYEVWCRDWATSHLPAQPGSRPDPRPPPQQCHQQQAGQEAISSGAASAVAPRAGGDSLVVQGTVAVATEVDVEADGASIDQALAPGGGGNVGAEIRKEPGAVDVTGQSKAAAAAEEGESAITVASSGTVAADGREAGSVSDPSGVSSSASRVAQMAAVAEAEVEALRRQRALVVERIRHTYGIDKTFADPEAMDTIRCNTQRVGNAVEQLSAQLYSKDLHFVMELMQNAEDNSYDPCVVPCLEFVLTPSALVVLNNETGFKEQDIRALSDVNMSTKKKKRGYIGKKGIGFKSVFKVSDAPEVHSNGFHVTFSREKYGNLGMVLPSVIPPYDGSDLPSQLGLVPARTIIRLPLIGKDAVAAPVGCGSKGEYRDGEEGLGVQDEETEVDAAEAVVESLRKPLKEVDPRLILFLKKLRCIAITDAASPSNRGPAAAITAPTAASAATLAGAERRPPGDDCTTAVLCTPGSEASDGLSLQVHKVELGGGLVSLRYGLAGQLQETRWLIVSDTFVPTVDRGDLSAAELGETEVSLSFDLAAAAEMVAVAGADGGSVYDRSRPLPRPPRQDVFAYLPTRDYGLRFMVNADFIVTTSREAVDSGSAWNQMLAARIPQLFARSLSELQQLDAAAAAVAGPSGLQAQTEMPLHGWLNYWLSCLPLPDEAQDLFSSLPQRISEAVRASVLLPTTCGLMLSPARQQLRVCQDPRVRELLSEPGVQSALRSAGLYFLSDAVLPLHANPRLRAMLHVQDFQAHDMVALLEMLLATTQKGTKACKDGDLQSQPPDGPQPGPQAGAPAGPLSTSLLARLLLVIFSALGAGGGGDRSGRPAYPPSWQGLGPSGYSAGIAGRGQATDRLWAVLRTLHLFPVLGSVDWAAVAGVGGATGVFLLPGWEEQLRSDIAGGRTDSATSSSGNEVALLLASVGLTCDLHDLLDPLSGPGADGAAGRTAPQIRFLDPALLTELPTVEQREVLLAGLRELGVRPLEAADVYDLAVLPLLHWYSAGMSGPSSSSVVRQLPEKTLVACLALPLAAGLMGPSINGSVGEEEGGGLSALGSDRRRAKRQLLQQQQPNPAWLQGRSTVTAASSVRGHAGEDGGGGSSLEQLRSCAVLLTSVGTVRCSQSLYSSAYSPPLEIYLPSALCLGGFNLRRSFPSWCEQHNAAVISDAYLACGAVPHKTWTWLFRQLGASPFLTPRPCTVLLWPPGAALPAEAQQPPPGTAPTQHRVVALQLETSPWRNCEAEVAAAAAALGEEAAANPPVLPRCPAGHVYRLEDVACPSLEDLLDHILPPGARQKHGAAVDLVWSFADLVGGFIDPSSEQPLIRHRQVQAKQRAPLTAEQLGMLEQLALALHALWEDGRYSEALQLRGAVAVVTEEAARAELAEAEGAAVSGREAARQGGEAWQPAGQGTTAAPLLPSSFKLTLATRRWLPTTQGFAASASEVVPPLSKLMELFGGAPLPFLSVAGLPADCPLLAALGLPARANPQLVVGLLSRLTAGGSQGSGNEVAESGRAVCARGRAAMEQGARGDGDGGGGVVLLEPDTLVRVYRYLGAAAQQDEVAFAEVCRAFAEEPLIWVPDGPAAASRPGAYGGSGAARGRFYSWQQVRLSDPTGVMEQLAVEELLGPAQAIGRGGGTAAAAASEALPLRVLEAHYPQKVLAVFEDLRTVRQPAFGGKRVVLSDTPLIDTRPSLDDYLAALRNIVRREPTAPPRAVQLARLILQQWSDGLASGALPEGGPVAVRLRLLLPDEAVFPTVGGGWGSVAGGLLLDDDPDLARLFSRLPGVPILDSASLREAGGLGGAAASASVSSTSASSPYSETVGLDRDRDRDPGHSGQTGVPLAPLLRLLGAPRLSQHVKEEISYESLRAGWQVERLVRISLQFVQRHLYHRRRELYKAVRETVAARLPRLQVFVVDKDSLKVLPRLCHPDGRPPIPAEAPLSRAAVLQMRAGGGGVGGFSSAPAAAPWLYVDDVRNYHKICEELSRLFTPSSIADRELASFLTCLILSHEQDIDPNRDTVRAAAEQYATDNGCGPLPDGEPEWEVPIGTLQQESAGVNSVSSAVVYDLPEHDPDQMLAALALPPQPRAPQPPGTSASSSTGVATAMGGGGFFNPYLTSGGGLPATDATGIGFAAARGDEAWPPLPSRSAAAGGGGAGAAAGGAGRPSADPGSDDGRGSAHEAGPGPGPGPGDGSGGFSGPGTFYGGEGADELGLGPRSGTEGKSDASVVRGGVSAFAARDGEATDTNGSDAIWGDDGTCHAVMAPGAAVMGTPDRGPRRPGVRSLGHLMGVVMAAYGEVAASAAAAAAAAAASPAKEAAREYGVKGGAGGYGAHYDDVAEPERQMQWMRLPDLVDGDDPEGQQVLEALRSSVAKAAAVTGPGLTAAGDGVATVEGGVSDQAAAMWAEALVYELLRHDPSVAANGWAVDWVSGREETRSEPYDILLTRGSLPGPLERVYVEVKSSRTTNKRSFEVSTQELSKAQREGASYVIFRLLGVGSLESLELLVLADPWAMCARKELRLCVLT